MADPGTIRAIVRAAIELTSRQDRDSVLDAILAELERLVPYELATVLVLEGDVLRIVAARGFRRDLDLRSRRFARGDNPRLDRALAARGTVRFTDPAEADPFDGLATAPLDHLHSCMAAPMRLEGRLLGLITADAHAPDRFAAGHEELMELFAALAAVAIRNADQVHALAEARARLEGEVATLAAEIREAAGGIELVGSSTAMRALRDDVATVGPTDTGVLVLGETGTGKELVARALHAASRRAARPLIRFDASAVAPTLIESELFGHARGAFTGAVAARAGKLEVADGGTLFLDEIGELPLALQPRLLRALQEREVERVGEHRVRKLDVRVIAATNRDLEAEVRAGRFRADLYHRLAVYPIRVPPLRERLDDLPALVEHFVAKLGPRLSIAAVHVEPAFLAHLAGHGWPGNVRELENTVERALVRARARGERTVRLGAGDALALGLGHGEVARAPRVVSPGVNPPALDGATLKAATERFQLAAIEAAMAAHGGSLAAAARALGEDRSNLHRRLKRLREAGSGAADASGGPDAGDAGRGPDAGAAGRRAGRRNRR
jgi:anaerobic nitric oxide reductase transcription regulator